MTGDELRLHRLSVNQTAKEAADECSTTERTWRRWEAADEISNISIVYWLDQHNIKEA